MSSEIYPDPELLALLKRLSAGAELSGEEKSLLSAFKECSGYANQLLKELSDEEWLRQQLQALHHSDTEGKWARLKPMLQRESRPAVHRVLFLRSAWFRYAAVLILLLGAGGYFWFFKKDHQPLGASEEQRITMRIPPGRQGAILTLADGSQLVLDSMGNGVIATQNGSRAILKNGQLAYNPTARISGKVMYNTMTTPKGRQFNVVLPDGTKVWLNAASSLRYPTVFGGKERQVTISGEAYFEVAKDKTRPFFVKINNAATIEVLGTKFNVNAYEDEASINTTLLEGGVRVQTRGYHKNEVPASARPTAGSDQKTAVLKPGQQAQITYTAAGESALRPDRQNPVSLPTLKVVDNADIDKVMAWKNGAFNFQDASLVEVMRQLERWYDIQVVYENGIPNIHFVGEMSRDISLDGVIRVLQGSEVHFRLEEGRRLVVLP